MMLYTAVLVACLSTAPNVGCRTHEIIVHGGANPISAFVEAQARAAEWLVAHPDLRQFSLTIHAGRGA